MSIEFTTSLTKVITEMNLTEIFLPENSENIQVGVADLNRPGLQLAGFFGYFDENRIQLFGKSEIAYLDTLDETKKYKRLDELFALKPVAVIAARGYVFDEKTIDIAKKYKVPVLMTEEATTSFAARLTALLNLELAPRVTRHGVLVEVYGEGVLLIGDSGVGKSETAVELVKRGHRLIADDAVEIRKVSDKTLVGSSPANIRHFLELRGIGIINISRIFGVGAIKVTENIDMVINLETWDNNKSYDRMGMDEDTMEILGIKIPSLTIPVTPGRNLAVIIEVAAMNHRQKLLGYNAAYELLSRLGMEEDIPKDAVKPSYNPFN